MAFRFDWNEAEWLWQALFWDALLWVLSYPTIYRCLNQYLFPSKLSFITVLSQPEALNSLYINTNLSLSVKFVFLVIISTSFIVQLAVTNLLWSSSMLSLKHTFRRNWRLNAPYTVIMIHGSTPACISSLPLDTR